MLSWILEAIAWILNIWSKLSQPTKDEIISQVAAAFDEIFRNYYRNNRKGGANE